MFKDSEHYSRQKEKLSSWILDYDKNAYCDSKISENNREVLIDSFNECSDLRKSFHNSLNQFFTNLGFSSMKNIRKYDNSFTYYEFANHDRHNKNLGEDLGFSFIKNNSMSKIDRNRGGIIDLKQKLRDNNKSKSKNKNKNIYKNKNVISLRKKIFMNELENSKENSDVEENELYKDENEKVIESTKGFSDERRKAEYKKEIEEKKEKERDYLLKSIYNQFGITKSQLLDIEEEKDNNLITQEEEKFKVKEEKNKKYPAKDLHIETNENKNKGLLSLLTTEKKDKEKIHKKVNKAEINKLLQGEKDIKDIKKEIITKKYEKPIMSKEKNQINITNIKTKDYNKISPDRNKDKIVYNKKINIEKNLEDKNINIIKTENEENIKKLSKNLKIKPDINEKIQKKIRTDNIK